MSSKLDEDSFMIGVKSVPKQRLYGASVVLRIAQSCSSCVIYAGNTFMLGISHLPLCSEGLCYLNSHALVHGHLCAEAVSAVAGRFLELGGPFWESREDCSILGPINAHSLRGNPKP